MSGQPPVQSRVSARTNPPDMAEAIPMPIPSEIGMDLPWIPR